MIKKLIFLLLICIFYSEFFFKEALADCNFKTGNYSEKLKKPNSIKNINIKVNNSKKYAMNSIKTYLTTVHGKRIDPKYRKKFKSIITVNYNFGSCKFKGKIWQNGDWDDHIKYNKDYKFIRSLNVKIDDGNILNATKFKLLIPETRNSKNEILASLILKELNILSPETAMVFVDVNNNKSKMIFQEDSQKELLERNNRREGPIFEGDETHIWSNEHFLLKNKGKNGLEPISLARLINNKWFLKGNSSQQITLSALGRLQEAYLEYSEKYINDSFFINPNNENNDFFTDYNFLMLSMNGKHALRPHNRKYYFNSFTNSFEPIYYDGNVKLALRHNSKNDLKILRFSKDYKFPFREKINDEKFQSKIKKKFKERVINFDLATENFFKNSIEIFKSNVNKLQKDIMLSSNDFYTSKTYNNYRKSFLDRNSETKTEDNIIKNFNIYRKLVSLELEDGRIVNTDVNGLSKVISRKNLNNDRYLFLPHKRFLNRKEKLKKKFLSGLGVEIIYPKNMNVIFEKNNTKPKLIIFQNNPNQSILIKGGNLENLEIIFKGLPSKDEIEKNDQRFNTRGLTGCLNIYNANIKDLSITVQNGKCEDSLNIINSIGNLTSLVVNNAYQDAIDLDFSNISIDEIYITNAGNDCLDVSGGRYKILNSKFINCSDKGISVGEKSNFLANNIFIDNSKIGIAIKDLSTFQGENVSIKNSNKCIEIFQKKLEFGGGYGNIEKLDCSGEFYVDKNSTLIYKKL